MEAFTISKMSQTGLEAVQSLKLKSINWSFIYPFVYLSIYLLICLLIYLFIYLFVYLFFISLFICLFIYLIFVDYKSCRLKSTSTIFHKKKNHSTKNHFIYPSILYMLD